MVVKNTTIINFDNCPSVIRTVLMGGWLAQKTELFTMTRNSIEITNGKLENSDSAISGTVKHLKITNK